MKTVKDIYDIIDGINSIAVLGAGKSGIETAKWARMKGINVLLSDIRPISSWPKDVIEWCNKNGVLCEGGSHSGQILSCDAISPSPGIPLSIPVLKEARKKNIPIIGELAIGLSLMTDAFSIGITGTNGKTTVTTLIGSILRDWECKKAEKDKKEVILCGNIGTPLISYVNSVKGYDKARLVIEISSFQLDLFPHGRHDEHHLLDVAVLLNISQDHLERYKDIEQYAMSKARLFSLLKPNGYGIIGEEALRLLTAVSPAMFNPEDYGKRLLIIPEHIEIKDEKMQNTSSQGGKALTVTLPDGSKELYNLNGISLIGRHNLKNIYASILMARLSNVAQEEIQQAISQFIPLEHRLEIVREIDEITFVNDSKATNIDALISALNSFDSGIILLAGGLKKGQDFSPLNDPLLLKKVKLAILFGKDARDLEKAMAGHCDILVINNKNRNSTDAPNGNHIITQGVRLAYRHAAKGDVVLFSPACASFDLFNNYKERGKAFKDAVFKL